MARHRDFDSLHLSQRSNGLAFSHHHFLNAPSSSSAYPPSKRQILLGIDSNTPFLPRSRLVLVAPNLLQTVKENKKSKWHLPRKPIKSLIPPSSLPPSRRIYANRNLDPKLASHRRKSLSSTSLKSLTPSILSRKRKFHPDVPTLASVPCEILDLIFQHLDQRSLHALLLTNTNLVETAAVHLYAHPHFASTYRYAQFTHTVTHKQHYASLVRELDLSYFGTEKEEDMKPQAGWREWKYRNSPIHQANRERRATLTGPIIGSFGTGSGAGAVMSMKEARKRSGSSSSHPLPHPFLERWSMNRDISVGGVCHVLAACQRLRKINLSHLQLSEDFLVHSPSHPPTTFTSLIYASDVPKSWTWESSALSPLSPLSLLPYLEKLHELEEFKANKSVWVTTTLVTELAKRCGTLKHVDFREAGMGQGMPWAMEGQMEEVRGRLRGMGRLPAR